MMSKEIRLPVRGNFLTMNTATIEEFQMAMENNFAMFGFLGEYTVQHNQQLGQPRQRGAQLSVLRKNFSLEGCSGETHREAPQGANKDVKS